MRRKISHASAGGAMTFGKHKRYLDLPPAPKKRKPLGRRLGWLKTVAAVVAAGWFASVVIPEKDREKLMELIGTNFGASETASEPAAAGPAPADG